MPVHFLHASLAQVRVKDLRPYIDSPIIPPLIPLNAYQATIMLNGKNGRTYALRFIISSL